MELRNRDEREAKVAKALKRLHGALLAELLRYLGDPPNPQRVPDAFWKKVERQYRRGLEPLLVALYFDAAKQLLPGQVTQQDAQRWGRDQAEELATDVATHSQEWFNSAKNRHDELGDDTGLLNSARSILSDARAQGIAATEVTRASVRGMSDAVERHNHEQPRKELVAYWNSQRDSDVCPICKPLHGKPLRTWGDEFPDGPPAHPNCRCWLDYKQGLKAENRVLESAVHEHFEEVIARQNDEFESLIFLQEADWDALEAQHEDEAYQIVTKEDRAKYEARQQAERDALTAKHQAEMDALLEKQNAELDALDVSESVAVLEYNPYQPRDERGRWTTTGAAIGARRQLEDRSRQSRRQREDANRQTRREREDSARQRRREREDAAVERQREKLRASGQVTPEVEQRWQSDDQALAEARQAQDDARATARANEDQSRAERRQREDDNRNNRREAQDNRRHKQFPAATLKNGQTVQFKLHSGAGDNATLLAVDPGKLDAEWSKDGDFYLRPNDTTNDIGNRREFFTKWMQNNPNEEIETPIIGLSANGGIAFQDGRHRTRVLLDQGIDRMYVTVDKSEAPELEQLLGKSL